MSILTKLLDFVRALYTNEPAVVVGAVVAAVVGVASALGIVVDQASATNVVVYVLSILFGSVAVRAKVTPSG